MKTLGYYDVENRLLCQEACEANAQGNSYAIRVSQLAIIGREYLVLFIVSDPSGNESDHNGAVQIVNSLHFFGRTHSR
jgi:hypothetical protein